MYTSLHVAIYVASRPEARGVRFAATAPQQVKRFAGKLGRFERETFQEFVPESFRWTDHRSRPGTNSLEFLIFFSQNRPCFPATALLPCYTAIEKERERVRQTYIRKRFRCVATALQQVPPLPNIRLSRKRDVFFERRIYTWLGSERRIDTSQYVAIYVASRPGARGVRFAATAPHQVPPLPSVYSGIYVYSEYTSL